MRRWFRRLLRRGANNESEDVSKKLQNVTLSTTDDSSVTKDNKNGDRQVVLNKTLHLQPTTNNNLTTIQARYDPEVLTRHKTVLRSMLECQFGLTDELDSRFVLTREEFVDVTTIGQNHGMFKGNDELLCIMIRKTDAEKHNEFLSALDATHQKHIASFIIKNGNVALCDDDERPLSETERDFLRAKQTFLLDELCMHGLMDSLYGSDCINEKHIAGINKYQNHHDQVRELMAIIMRRSFGQYKQFVECVRVTSQEHVVRVLESNGVVTSANATLKVPDEQSLMELERNIMDQFNRIRRSEDRAKLLNKLLGLSDVEVVAIVQKHSLRLYFLCMTLGAIRELRCLFDCGQLRIKIEWLFNYLLAETSNVPVIVSYFDLYDYVMSEDCFSSVFADKNDAKLDIHFSESQVTNLPLQLTVTILRKSFALIHMRARKETLQLDQTISETLKSVCTTWRNVVKHKKWLSESLKRTIETMEYLSYRQSLNKHNTFIFQNLECDYGLVSSLVYRQVLSKEQADYITDEPNNEDRHKYRLLTALEDLKNRKQRKEMFEALMETKQEHIARCLAPFYSDDPEDHLTEVMKTIITLNRWFLVSEIKTKVLDSLLAVGCSLSVNNT